MVASRLVVRPLPGGSARQGVTVLGVDGVPAGALVRFRNGRRQVVGRTVWLFGDSRPRAGEVWLDEWQRRALGVEPGQVVEYSPLESAEVHDLTSCDLAWDGAGSPA